MSFDRLEDRGRIPAGVAASFMGGLKKSAAMNPGDAALGALVGGGYAFHQSSTRHKRMKSGETPFSNKTRHELESHLETRQDKLKPSFTDRMNEKLIRAKLRYGRLAEKDPHKIIALETAMGALTGAVAGGQIGSVVRNSKALGALTKMNSDRTADVLGLNRDVLNKKAELMGIFTDDMVDLEMDAFMLSKKASLSSGEQAFLRAMSGLQQQALGSPPDPIKRASVNPATARALSKSASMGKLLLQKLMRKDQAKAAMPPASVEMAANKIEPNDYRAPVREERRSELLGIFGG